jgi:hypothetical protein
VEVHDASPSGGSGVNANGGAPSKGKDGDPSGTPKKKMQGKQG